MKDRLGPLFCIVAVAMVTLGTFGALIGVFFGYALMGALIGAAIPPVWCVIAWCFFKGLDIVFKGQWG